MPLLRSVSKRIGCGTVRDLESVVAPPERFGPISTGPRCRAPRVQSGAGLAQFTAEVTHDASASHTLGCGEPR